MDGFTRAHLDQDAAQWRDHFRETFGIDPSEEPARRILHAAYSDLMRALTVGCCVTHTMTAWFAIVGTELGLRVDGVRFHPDGEVGH